MIPLPASLQIKRSKKTEATLMKKARAWVEGGERSPGIHASDLLDPRTAYWQRAEPKPLPDRLIPMFLIGRVLHAFVLSAVEGVALDWKSDEGSRTSDDLGIVYSPDKMIKGIPRELKTSRSFYEPKTIDDLSLYAEQLLIYMAAEKVTSGQLWVLFLNHKNSAGRTSPEFRAYTVTISGEDLVTLTRTLKETRELLEACLVKKSPDGLPLCRKFKCGEGNCEWWDSCKPEGRYGVPQKKWEA